MSHIGKKIIFVPKTFFFKNFKNYLIFYGDFGVLKINININLKIIYKKNALYLQNLDSILKKNKFYMSMWGNLRARIFKISQGLLKLHFLKFKFIGVGFKAFLKKRMLILRLGYSHKYFNKIPQNVTLLKIKKRPPTFLAKSFDLNLLKTTVFNIRFFKKPEIYKGKGIVLFNEVLKKKEGKRTKN